MRVSVCIPAKNEERHLSRLLPALRRQTIKAEIIVALAPSEDRSERVAKKYGSRVVRGGLPAIGRNRAARNASGEYVVFLDADVLPCCDAFLEHAVREMRHKDASFATVDNFQSGSRLRFGAYYKLFQNPMIRLTAALRIPHAVGTCIIARRSAHRRIGGFDERIAYAEDAEYVLRATRVGHRFVVLDTPLHIIADPRRLYKDGVLGNMLFGLKAEWHRLMYGEITDLRYIDRAYFEHRRIR